MALSAELRTMHAIVRALEKLEAEEGADARARVEAYLLAKLGEAKKKP